MRTLLISLLAATSLSVTADDHYYGGFELGLSASPEADLNRDADGLSLEAEKNIGAVGGLFFGKARGKQRFELEYLVRRNYFDEVDVSNVGATALAGAGEYAAGGSQRTDSLMANVWHTFAAGDKWALLGGIGLGTSHVKLDRVRSGQTVTYADDSKWLPAVQAMAQFTHPIGTGLDFGVGYRYLHTLSGDFASSLGEVDYKATNHEVFARVSWKFGEDAKPAPAPMPAVAPAPAPKPAPAPTPVAKPEPLPGPFMVFFDFDKSTITTTAADIIKAAAKAFKAHKAVEIQATGHTDRAGADRYNIKLSEKRADAVKAALVAEGVPAENITLAYKGEFSPLIQTEDGIREWQNRRAEIVLVVR